MIKITVSEQPIFEHKTQGLVFFVEYDAQNQILDQAERYFPLLRELFEREKFTGALHSQIVVPAQIEDRIVYLIFIGLGHVDNHLSVETYRRALGSMMHSADKHRLISLAVNVPPASRFNAEPEHLAQETACTVHMAAYYYDAYITDEARKYPQDVDITLVTIGDDQHAYARGIEKGEIIATAVNKARLWVDTPPSELTPPELARRAQLIAQEYKLAITVFSEEEVKKMGMGGLAGVAAGSEQDCNLVIMEYEAPKKDAPRIGIVGKGITFDAGGLSIKPAHHMENMKEDMSGAAAVIATMEAIARLKPAVHVTAVVPLAENLPSGTATKPGDILRFYNGKTAEVRNTDAEGRLILADALSYAVKHYKLDALIDIATLTGACAHALGPFFAGLMGKDEDLLRRIEKAAHFSGDRVWRLPFDDDYKTAIQSPIADMCNIGKTKYMAGAITAGFFLYNFVNDVPWAHLDIAGVAYNVPDISYYRPGATGYGVRLLTELITHW